MTNLVRFNDPFAGLSSLHSQLDDMFNSFFGPGLGGSLSQGAPAIDVYVEDDKQLVSEVQAPGFKPEDVEVTVSNGVLEIRGKKHEKEEEGKDKKRSYMVRESHASFYRSIVLPKHADADSIQADFKDGVLKVIVPFKELPQPKKIAIGSGK
jgi:HSP20 family protein